LKIKHTSDYSKKRAEAYPDVTEQLDMLWHAMNSGQAEKIEPFYSSIASVKQKFPKPDTAI